MSASKERKQELELERQRQREEEAKADRRSMRLYAVVGVLCAVIGIGLLVMNSGILQRSMTAVSVNGTDYTAADMQYYYGMEYQNLVTTAQTYAMYGMDYGFDFTVDPEDQIYNEETGESWEDYLVDNAKKSVAYVTALVDAANEAGHTMSQEAQDTLNEVLTNVDSVWVGSYNNRDSFIRATYGPYMTYDRFVELVEREILASDYVNAAVGSIEYTDAEYDAYYAEHADELDTFTLTQFVLQAKAPEAGEGEQALSEEEKAAGLEQAAAEKKKVAEEILKRMSAGEDPEELADEYADELLSTSISAPRLGSSVSSTDYAEWAVEDGRAEGDTTMAEYVTDTVHNFYVVRYEGRELNTANTADVRHILVAAETDEGAVMPTDDQYAAAKEKAELLLTTWQNGEATEEAFAALAVQNSADSGSAAEGGLMTAVNDTSGFIKEFTDWALDPAREVGDTGIVKNTGSTTKGWHIMYYVGDNLPVWKQTADSAMLQADYAAWEAEVTEGYEAVEGAGMKFL